MLAKNELELEVIFNLTTIDESYMPSDIVQVQVEADYWRLNQYIQLFGIQKQKLFPIQISRHEIPFKQIPCYTELQKQIQKIAFNKNKFWLEWNTYELADRRIGSTATSNELKRFLKYHGSGLTKSETIDFYEVIRILNKPDKSTTTIKIKKVIMLNDLDVINLHLITELNSCNSSDEAFFKAFTAFASISLREKKLCQRLKVGYVDDIFSPKVLTEHGFDLDALKNDTRNVFDICEEKLKDRDPTLPKLDEAFQIKLLVCLFFNKLVVDPVSYLKAFKISLRSFNALIKMKSAELNSAALSSTIVLPQIILILQETEDQELAELLLNNLTLRMSYRKYGEEDMQFYMSQIVQNEDADVQNIFFVENAFIYKLLNQVIQIRCTKKQDNDISAFDTPQIGRIAPKGAMSQQLVLTMQIQQAIYNFLYVCQVKGPPAILNGAKNKYFRTIWHSALMQTLTIEPVQIEQGKIVLHQTISMLVLCLSAEKNKFTEVGHQQLQEQYESLIAMWLERVDQTIYCLSEVQDSENQDQIVELEQSQKAALIVQILRQYIQKSNVGRQPDWGSRLYEGKLIKNLADYIIPTIIQSPQSNENLNPILLALVQLISEMIDNEIHLISLMLKPVDNQTEGIITQLLKALSTNSYSKKQNQMLKVDQFKVITIFLGRLSITEQGKEVVLLHGAKILETVMDATFEVSKSGNYKQLFTEFFEINPSTERLFQFQPINAVIRSFLAERIKDGISALEIYLENYYKYAEKSDQQVASRVMRHSDRVCNAVARANLQFLVFKDTRSTNRREDRLNSNYSPTLTQLFKTPGNNEAVLKQRPDILQLFEIMSACDWSSTEIFNIIRTLMLEAQSGSSQAQEQTALFEKSTKQSISHFANQTNLLQCTSFEQLKTNSIANKTTFNKMQLYADFVFATPQWRQMRNWSEEIRPLTHLFRLLCKKWFDLTIKDIISNEFSLTNNKKNTKKALQVTAELSSFVPLVKQLEIMHQAVRSHVQSQFLAPTHDFPLKILQAIQSQAFGPDLFQHRAGFEPEKEDVKTMLALGEHLADLSKQLKYTHASSENLLEWCGHNEAIIQVLSVFTLTQQKMSGPQHLAFVYKNGIVPLCRLYKYLLQQQDKLFNVSEDIQSEVMQIEESKSSKTQQTIIKAIVLAQKESVAKLLMSFIIMREQGQRSLQGYRAVKVAEYTKNKFQSVKHLICNQYHQLFVELLQWDFESPENDKQSLVLQLRKPNYDNILEHLVKAFANKSWKVMEQVDHNGPSNGPGRRFTQDRRGREIDPNREVTQAELEQVTALGFDPNMATNAIRMAGFDTVAAIEIILNNESGLMMFIQQQTQLKAIADQQQQKKDEKLKQQAEDVEMNEEVLVDVISIETFEKLVTGYQRRLLNLMLQTTPKSVVDQESALRVIKKLQSSQNMGFKSKDEVWTFLFQRLQDSEDEFCKLTLLIKVMLLQLQVSNSKPNIASLPQISTILQKQNRLFGSINQTQAQVSLYYFCFFLHKMIDSGLYSSCPQTNEFCLQVLSLSQNTKPVNLTKDLIVMTVCSFNIADSSDQFINFLECIDKAEQQSKGMWLSKDKFISQITSMSLQAKPSVERLLEQVLDQSFLAMYLYKTELMNDLAEKVTQRPPLQLAQYQYNDIIKLLLIITQDISLIKQVLSKLCTVYRLKANGQAYCMPNQIRLLNMLTAQPEIKEIKADMHKLLQKLYQVNQTFESQIQPNEKATINVLLSCLGHTNFESKATLNKFLEKLSLFAKWTRVYPHFLCLLKMNSTFEFKLDEQKTFYNFAKWFVIQLNCTNGDELTAEKNIFTQKLTEVLCALVGTNQFTSVDEFCIRYSLKCEILKVAAETISKIDPQSLDSKLKLVGCLEILRCLCKFNNGYEFNRVLLAPRHYYDSIEYLIVQTNFMSSISSIINTITKGYVSCVNTTQTDELLRITFDLVQTICNYAEIYKTEKKENNSSSKTLTEVAPRPQLQNNIQDRIQQNEAREIAQNQQENGDQSAQVAEMRQIDAEMEEGEEEQENQESSSSDMDQDAGDEEEVMIEESESGYDEQNSDSYDEEEDDGSNQDQGGVQFHHRNNGIAAPSNQDIIMRPPQTREQFAGRARLGGFLQSSLFEALNNHPLEQIQNLISLQQRGGQLIVREVRENELSETIESRFSEAWTQQEQIAQNLLHTLFIDDNANYPECHHPNHLARDCPQSEANRFGDQLSQKTIESRQKLQSFNNISQRFDVFKMSDKQEMLKSLKENMQEFSKVHDGENKKEIALQFRTYTARQQYDPFLPRGFRFNIEGRDVDHDTDPEELEMRVRAMETHVRMMIEMDGELGRDENRYQVFMSQFDRADRDGIRDDGQIDLIGTTQSSQEFRTNLGEQLLQQLNQNGSVPIHQGAVPSQSSDTVSRDEQALNTVLNPFLLRGPLLNPFAGFSRQENQEAMIQIPELVQPRLDRRSNPFVPQGIHDELPDLFRGINLQNQNRDRPEQAAIIVDIPMPENQRIGINVEEVKQEAAQVQEEAKVGQNDNQVAQPIIEPSTYGYPNSVLLANDISPDILHDLPEDVRAELLSTINYNQSVQAAHVQVLELVPPPIETQNQQNQAIQIESNVQPAQIQPNTQVIVEETKDNGLDQEFLANLPEDMREEIIRENARARNQQSRLSVASQALGRQARQNDQQQDWATLLTTVTDPQLRNDILIGIDPTIIATLPENLRQEVQRVQQADRVERQRQRRFIQNLQRDQWGHAEHIAPQFIPRQRPAFPMFEEFAGYPFIDGSSYDILDEQRRRPNLRIKTAEDIDSLYLSVDECFYKLVNKDNLFKIQELIPIVMVQIQDYFGDTDKLMTNLISLLESQVNLNFSLKEQNQPKLKFNLISVLNSVAKLNQNGIKDLTHRLVQVIKESIINTKTEILTDEQAKIQKQVNRLILIGSLRLLIQMNSSFAVQILQDFLFQPISAEDDSIQIDSQQQQSDFKSILDLLQKLNQDSELDESRNMSRAFQRNLLQATLEILGRFDKVFSKKKPNQLTAIQEQTILSLTQILDLPIADSQLVLSVGKSLLKISKQKSENLNLILEKCQTKFTRAQQGIVNGLQKAISHQIDEDDDKLSVLSLKYNMSQSSQQQQNDIQMVSKEKLSQDELRNLELTLKETQSDLVQFRHMSQIINLFMSSFVEDQAGKDSQIQILNKVLDNQTGKKNQIHILNEVLNSLKHQKNIKPEILQALKAHIGCIYEINQVELNRLFNKNQNVVSNNVIKMQPLNKVFSVQSSKQKLSASVFKNATEVSDQLYEFCKFCLINKDIINKIITLNNTESVQVFSLSSLVKVMPNVLNFQNKKEFFKKEINKLKRDQRASSLRVSVRRKEIFMESYAMLGHKSATEMKGQMNVDFQGERGTDAGGLTRDFFIELSRAMFNPNYSLFKLASNGVSYYPNEQSFVNQEHLNFFKFIGRMIGKALFDGHLLECYFSKPLYKMMVGDDLLFEDQQDLDDDAYRGYKWTIENDVSNQEMYFCVDVDYFGKIEQKELVAGGIDIKVTNENKLDYLEKVGKFKMYDCIKEQVDSFLKGFHELIPKHLVSIFSYQELELLISGLPDFNLNDLRLNTLYTGGYNENSPQVRWLWQTLSQASKEEIGRFLQFVTGSSRIPLEGFKALQGMRGPQKFTIARIKDTNKLPMGHTCYNQIDLPEYASLEILKEKVLYAIRETAGFGFA